jgi:hypothetical protein
MCRNTALRQVIWHHCRFLSWTSESIFRSSITHLDLSNCRFQDHQLDYLLRCTPYLKTLYLFGYNFPLSISMPSLCWYGGWMKFPNGSSGQGLVEGMEPGSVDRFLQEGILGKDLTIYAVSFVDVTKNHLSLQLVYQNCREQHDLLTIWRPLLPPLLPRTSSVMTDPELPTETPDTKRPNTTC